MKPPDFPVKGWLVFFQMGKWKPDKLSCQRLHRELRTEQRFEQLSPLSRHYCFPKIRAALFHVFILLSQANW